MSEVYRTCASYRDHGKVHVRGVPAGTFETTFLRSANEFSFAFNADDGSQYVVRAEGAKLIDFRLPDAFPPKLRTPDSFGAAIATITGITLGSGHVVPRMLLSNDLGGRSICAVSQPVILREEPVAGEACVWIELGTEFPDTAVLVNKKTYALCRFLVFPSRRPSRDPSSAEHARDPALLVPKQQILYEPQIS